MFASKSGKKIHTFKDYEYFFFQKNLIHRSTLRQTIAHIFSNFRALSSSIGSNNIKKCSQKVAQWEEE